MDSFLKAKQVKNNSEVIFGKNHIINNISFAFLFLFGGIEIYKISAVVSNYPLIVTFVYLGALALILTFLNRIDFMKLKFGKFISESFLIFVVLLTTVISLVYIHPDVLKIPEVNMWISRFSAGLNPYLSVHERYLPIIYFILAPFTLIGNILLANTVAIGVFLFVLLIFNRKRSERIFAAFLLFSLPQLYAQFSFGSPELLSVSICLLIFSIHKNEEITYGDPLSIILISILCGLMFLTLVELSPLLILWMIFSFRSNIPKLLMISGMSVGTAFLINLALFNFDFTVLSSSPFFNNIFTNLGAIFTILFAILLLYAGWMAANLREVIFAAALFITLLWAASIISQFLIGTASLFQLVLYENTGLIFSAFFLFLISIHEYRVDRFLGRVYPLK